jgi:hypothetical protein
LKCFQVVGLAVYNVKEIHANVIVFIKYGIGNTTIGDNEPPFILIDFSVSLRIFQQGQTLVIDNPEQFLGWVNTVPVSEKTVFYSCE